MPYESSGLWCQFTLSAAGPRVWTNNSTAGTWPYSNINATTVDVTWYSDQDVTGFYTYQEVGSSIARPVTSVMPVRLGPGNWSYSIEVYGLQSLASYGGAFGVSWTNGCLVEEDQLSGQVPHLPNDPGFVTADPLTVSEEDQSFDSVTGIGGGVNLTWNDQGALVGRSITSGYVTIQNVSTRIWKEIVPITPSEIVNETLTTPTKKTYVHHIIRLDPALNPGTVYRATLTANYTGLKPESGTTLPFTYHLDSSGDGLTNLEKTAGWNVSYAPSGTVVISKNTALHANLVASNIIIDAGVTLTTNGFNIVAANEFANYGVIDTGTVNYPQNPNQLANFTLSYGGSGGGAYTAAPGGYLAGGNGGSTLSGGGTASYSHNAGAGATPGAPHLSSQLIGAWWGGSMRSYLSGAAGGLYTPGFGNAGGLGRWGLYIQAYQLIAGQIMSAGMAGQTYSGCAPGWPAAGGGGGGGSILLAYGSFAQYRAPTLNDSGGPSTSCPGNPSSGHGGSGRLITYLYSTPPVPPPASPTFAGSTMKVTHVHATVSERVGWKVVPVFSTNGLTNDYLEKAYGLNPNTVDTAGSDMLDLWNLSFDLGAMSVAKVTAIPGVLVWSEVNTSTWDPWGPGGSPSGWGVSITCTAASCPGNASFVSSLIWPASQFWVFMNLSGVKYDLKQGNYLRGVIGYWGSDLILTLWGKLSWGADPLAGSTPGNEIPDGARVNPVGGTDLQVTVTTWFAANSSSNYRAGNGVAAFIDCASSGTPEYGNFTNQTNVTSSIWNWWIYGWSTLATFNGSFVVTFPADPTQQYAQLNLSLVQNTGVNGGNSYQTPLRTPVYQVDLENPAGQSNSAFWQNSSSGSYMIQFHWQVLPVQAKAPTWIYIPVGNATLSALPRGLQRYTGEQNFIELVVNDSAPTGSSPTVSGLPYANNTSNPAAEYTFGLSPGLNNLLIPRSVFLSTPFGRSVLNLSGSSTPDIPIQSANGDGFLQTQWQAGGNGALWFNRTTAAGGYTKGSPGFIEVVASTSTVSSTNRSLTGGVPDNPSLESGYTSLAIQAIYATNESSTGDVENLLAGLLLNTTGNFTGWLLNATGNLDTLGLLPSVMAGLANATYVNDGSWSAPSSNAVVVLPHHNWWDFPADWSWFWNSVSGVFTGAVSLVWNAAIAAAAFFADLVKATVRFAFNVFEQAASTLQKVAAVIASAFGALLQWLVDNVIKPMLNAALRPFYSIRNAYGSALDQAIDPSSPRVIWNAIGGSVFLIGYIVAMVFEIILVIAAVVSFGTEQIVGILVGALVGVGLTFLMALVPFLTSVTTSLVTSCQQFAGTYVDQSSQSANWTTMAGAVSYWEAGPSNEWAAIALSQANSNPISSQVTSFTFAMAALSMSWYADATLSMEAADASSVLAGISIVLSALGLKGAKSESNALLTMDVAILGMDIAAFGADVYDWTHGA